MSKTHGFQTFNHPSKEIVLASDFNQHGTRLVTGSGDHRIRVFELNEKIGEWNMSDVWRGHNAEVLDVKFNSGVTGTILASIGEDLKLKIWSEDENVPRLSGRRWKTIYSQTSGRGVIYSSISFLSIRHETYLATVTRDGYLTLMEPVQTSIYNDWKDTDSFYVCDEAISRGTETSFKLNFQNCSAPNFNAVKAGLDKNALSLVVTALNEVRVFRILQSGYKGDGPYKFSSPAAELTGARGLVRDVSWAPTPWKLHDQIATASADGYVRIYDIWTPKQSSDSHPQQLSTTSERNNTFARGYNNRPQSGIGAGLAGVAESELGHSEAGQIIHDWKLVAELKHEGVWKVEWLQNGGALVSAGDTGKAHLWRHAVDGSWKEFADFGPGEVGT